MPPPKRPTQAQRSRERLQELFDASFAVEEWVSPPDPALYGVTVPEDVRERIMAKRVPSVRDRRRHAELLERHFTDCIEHPLDHALQTTGPSTEHEPPGRLSLPNDDGTYRVVESITIHVSRKLREACGLAGEAHATVAIGVDGKRCGIRLHCEGSLPLEKLAELRKAIEARIRFILDETHRGRPADRGKWADVSDFLADMHITVRKFRRQYGTSVPTVQRMAELYNRPADDESSADIDTDDRVSERTLQNWCRRAGFATWTDMIENLSR
jgi:hypothetical protein